MIAHPLLAAVLVLDLTAVLLVAAGAVTAVRVLLGWAPESSSAAQLGLEARADGAAVLARIAAVTFVAATTLLLVAVSGVLPDVVPGAMCGTGVLQAMGGLGERVFVLRGVALCLLAGWYTVEQLNRSHPRAPLTTATARALLLAAPLLGLAVLDTLRALWSLDVESPVDCCAAVYDRAVPSAGAAPSAVAGDTLILLTFVGGLVLGALGAAIGRLPGRLRPAAALALGVGAPAWVGVAAIALVDHLAAYHYGVLHHRCPWCLFLVDHYAIGFALFAALAVVAMEGPLAMLAATLARRGPLIAAAAYRRGAKSGVRVALGVFAFLLIAGVPPLVWRLRFGTWMH